MSGTLRCLIPVLLLTCQLPLAADDFAHLSGAGTNQKLDELSFANTLKWDRNYLSYIKRHTRYLRPDWKRSFALPAPPANSSARTKAELGYLKQLVALRPTQKKEIEAEVLVAKFRWGKFSYEELTAGKKFEKTSVLLRAAYRDLGVVCFTLKHRFNRVRPSTLETELNTLVAIPGHPAYPSGHSTGAFTIAYILQELDPENGENYRKDALRIAQNREIGGLHYPSDTEAGRILAHQIADSLLANPRFQHLLKAARPEWR